MDTSNPHLDLSPQWGAILEIYDAFASIANRHGLRFYLGFGSALGAVRHGGFIPWDDDLDVEMPRCDYERFREIAGRELPSHLKWVDCKNTPEFLELFGKIVDSRRDVYERVVSQTGISFPQGIFIDIFPLDGVPRGIRGMVRRVRRLLLRTLVNYRLVSRPTTLPSRLSHSVGRIVSWFFPGLRTREDLRDYVDRKVRTFPMEKARFCGTPTPNCCELTFIEPVDVFGVPEMVPFCGRLVPIPHDFDTYLKTKYGNYMVLPPEERRRPPHRSDETDVPWKFGPTRSVSSGTDSGSRFDVATGGIRREST